MHCILLLAHKFLALKFSWFLYSRYFLSWIRTSDNFSSESRIVLERLGESGDVWLQFVNHLISLEQVIHEKKFWKIAKFMLCWAVLDIELGQIFVRRMIFWRRGCVISRRLQSQSWMIFFFSRPLSSQSLKKAMSISFFFAHSMIYSSQTAITAKS